MKKFYTIFVLLALFVLSALSASAQINDSIIEGLQTNTETNEVYLLVRDHRQTQQVQADRSDIMIDDFVLTRSEVSALSNSNVPVLFVFIIDTTKTVYQDEQELAGRIAENLAAQRNNRNDNYIIVGAGDEIGILAQGNDPTTLFSQIEMNSNHSDYRSALVGAVNNILLQRAEFEKKVVILLTDGSVTMNNGASESDAREALLSSNTQLITIGQRNSEKQNYDEKDLQALAKLSENTGGIALSTKQTTNPADLASDIIAELNKTLVIRTVLPEEFNGKTNSEIKITLKSQTSVLNTIQATADLSNFVFVPEEPIIDETTSCEGSECTEEGEKAPNAILEWFNASTEISGQIIPNLYLAIAGAVVLILAIVLIAVSSSKRKKAAKKENTEKYSGNTAIIQLSAKDSSIGLAPIRMTLNEGQSVTFGRTTNEAKNIIGLNEADKKISHKHFSVTYDYGKLYIADEGSTNGTRVNGKPVSTKIHVASGSTITAGLTEFSLTSIEDGSEEMTQMVEY